MTPTNHINPGTDVTVSPPGLVIDDSYRSRKMLTKEDQILENQKILAKAMLWIVWKTYPLNPSFETREMRKGLAKLAGEP